MADLGRWLSGEYRVPVSPDATAEPMPDDERSRRAAVLAEDAGARRRRDIWPTL